MTRARAPACALLLACLLATGLGRPQPARGADGAVPAVVREARTLLRAQRAGEALSRLRAEGGLSLAAPERSWVLAQLAPALQGLGAIRAEVARLPRAPLRLALEGLLAEQPAPARDELRLAQRTWRDPWLALAEAQLCLRLGEHAEAGRAAARAAATGGIFVRLEALQAETRGLVEEGRLEEALARARQAAELDPSDARPWALGAEVRRRLGQIETARESALQAFARAPRSEAYARRLAELLREPEAAVPLELWGRVEQVATAAHGEALALRAHAAEARGALPSALDLLRGALAAGANPVPLERRLRLLLARLGRYGELAAALARAVPESYRDAPSNLLAPRWAALARAAAAAPDASAPPPARVDLARALIGLGALEAARVVLETASDEAGRALRERLEGHLAFERELRAQTESGYRLAGRKQDTPSIDAFLLRVRTLATRHLTPADAALLGAPATGLRRVALLGAWLDHRARSQAPLVAYFRGYGRYLVLGQRADQPCETILLSLGVSMESAELTTRGRRLRHDFALGYDREIRSFVDSQGGGLAGACLPDGLWLDADAALDAEHDARSLLRRDPSLLEAARRLPVPLADGPAGPFALFDQGGVLLRLLARYVEREPAGRWGSLGTLHAHENGHVIDLRRHLPLWNGLPATLSLLAREGLSLARMEAALERRAQLAAVIDAPDPELAVTEMLQLLPAEGRDPEAHAAGYRDALARMVHHIWSRPDLYPEIDRARLVLPQLDRLSNAQLRQAARSVVDG